MITITGTTGDDNLSAFDPADGFSFNSDFLDRLEEIAPNSTTNFAVAPGQIRGAHYALSNSGETLALIATVNRGQVDPAERNPFTDVYLLDRDATSIELVSTRSDGTQPATFFSVTQPDFSPNDQQIAFISDSAFLDGVDTNSRDDLFVKNLVTEELVRVTDSESGVQANGHTRGYLWLDDSTILIDSLATNLVDGEEYSGGAFYIKNIVTGSVSVLEFAGLSARDLVKTSFNITLLTDISMSDDGRFYTFSTDMEFDGSEEDDFTDIYLYDTVTEEFSLVSTDSDGNRANPLLSGNQGSTYSDISPDGNLVAFLSDSGSFVDSDTNSVTDVFVKNIQTGETIRISVPNDGGEISSFTGVTAPVFSPDGSMILFGVVNQSANSGGLLTGIYVWSVDTGTVERIVVPVDEVNFFVPTEGFTNSRGLQWLPDSSGILYFTNTLDPIEILFTSDTTVGVEISGLGGDDRITGSRNNDILDGGTGADDIFGGAGNDIILGGDQNDNLFGGSGNDQVLGQRGADFLYGGAGDDLVLGGNRNDRLFGESGNDRVFGGNDQDIIDGGSGVDIGRGGNGDDELFGGSGGDVLFGGTGRDTLWGEVGDDFLFGRGGFDVLIGGEGNDTLEGGIQADQFIFADGFGNDIITDFASLANGEKIHLTDVSEITDFSDLVNNHMNQVGADVVIADGLGNTITLLGVNISDLDAVDFVF